MKGSVGTSTHIVSIRKGKKKMKLGKKKTTYCPNCKSFVAYGSWVAPTYNGLWKHLDVKECKKAAAAAAEQRQAVARTRTKS